MFHFLASLIMFSMVMSLMALFVVLWGIGRMRLFQKAGIAGWKAWIPFYRDYVLCEITMGKGWYFIIGLIPPFWPVMKVVYAVEVSRSYGQELLFAVLYYFLPWICELVLGFGKAEYLGSQDLEGQLRSLFGAPRKTYAAPEGRPNTEPHVDPNTEPKAASPDQEMSQAPAEDGSAMKAEESAEKSEDDHRNLISRG